jgi:GTP-binding protein EngB required for normal cell division
MIEGYILKNRRIRKIVWLFDVRRQMDHLDMTLMEWLNDNNLDFFFVLTKSDKEKQGDLIRKKRFFDDYLKGIPVFLFSSKTGKGKNELVSYLIDSVR